jgi:MtrB/PioB family decaheme-associated outer membrane protein
MRGLMFGMVGLLIAPAARAETPETVVPAEAAAAEAVATQAPGQPGAAPPGATPPAQPATPDVAAEPGGVMPPAFSLGRVDFALQGVETDTRSSKFYEYRDLPTGPLPSYLRLAGRRGLLYDVIAEDALQDDARYRASAESRSHAFDASYALIPHRFGNDARSLLEDTGRGVLSVSDTLQRSFQAAIAEQFARSPSGVNYTFLNNLVQPSLAAQDRFDLQLRRDQGRLTMDLWRDRPVAVRVAYHHERRRGDRGSGTAFGFNNVVETPEPIDYRTQDLALSAEWTPAWGMVRGGLRLNLFDSTIETQDFDNPFRATDSTDPSAYQSPSSSSIGGPVFGRLALPPDNRSVTGTLGFVWKARAQTRVAVDTSYGVWTQDEAFIPFGTNTAIRTPVIATDPASLPASSLDGRMEVFTLSGVVSSRPADRLTLTGRVRRYDLGNETPRIAFPLGYVRFDAVWEDIPRINVPYGHVNDQATAAAAWDFGPVTAEAGWRFDRWKRTYRETEDTKQNTGFLSASWRVGGWGIVRGSFEAGHRGFDHYDPVEAEHASFLEPGPATNLPSLRRYDQATKDLTRAMVLAQFSPWETATFSLSYTHGRDDYQESPHGLIDSKVRALAAEVDWSPVQRLSLTAFYTRDDVSTFQRGRQSGSSPSTNPADDWTSQVDDEFDSFGADATVTARENVEVALRASYHRADGHNDLDSPPGGSPDRAVDIPEYDDTRLVMLSAEVRYRLSSRWQVAAGGWIEDYEIRDAASSGLPNYAPGGFFLAPVDSDYRGSVLYLRAAYTW